MLKDLIKQSRSYRSFDPEILISPEQLTDWIDCARYCPSSINLQMLKFLPVTDVTKCTKILACIKFAGKLKDIKLPPEGHAPTAYVVICADSRVIPGAEKFQKDVGICAQTIMLAACEAGFGGCMIGAFSATDIAQALQLPDHLLPQLILALGKPDETVCLAELPESGDTSYYRQNGIHYSPKRPLEDLIIK